MGKLTNLNPVTIADSDIPGSIARDTEVTAALAAHLNTSHPHTQYTLKTEFYSVGDIGTAAPVSGAFNFMGAGTTPAERTQNGAFIAFHRPGIAANYFGLATDNRLKFGGWTDVGNSWDVFHGKYGQPVWQSPSDRKLKRKIRPIASALDLILEAKPVSFEYNNKLRKEYFGNNYQREKVHYGFLADDFPLQDLVTESVTEKDGNNYLGVDYVGVIPFLVRAIQELQAQINDLKNGLVTDSN